MRGIGFTRDLQEMPVNLPPLRFPDFGGRKHRGFVWKGIRSCNMGVWRTDFEAINGFDESFVGWGHEDADFVLRLHNHGSVRKNGFCATEVYHLWHTESSRAQESVNAQKVRERMRTGEVLPTLGYREAAMDRKFRSGHWDNSTTMLITYYQFSLHWSALAPMRSFVWKCLAWV